MPNHLIKFEASWCQPCQTLTQVMKGIEHTRIDIDTPDGEALAKHYKVQSLPTLILIDGDGNVLKISNGLKTREWLDEWLSHGDLILS